MTANLRFVPKDHSVISTSELERLHAKAKAHDQYVAAAKRMGERQSQVVSQRHREYGTGLFESRRFGDRSSYYASIERAKGWLDCLSEYNKAVLDAGTDGGA